MKGIKRLGNIFSFCMVIKPDAVSGGTPKTRRSSVEDGTSKQVSGLDRRDQGDRLGVRLCLYPRTYNSLTIEACCPIYSLVAPGFDMGMGVGDWHQFPMPYSDRYSWGEGGGQRRPPMTK